MKLLIAGDYCPLNRAAKLIEDGQEDLVLGRVKELTASADYSIANLECPIVYGGEKPPLDRISLSCKEEGLKALQWAGFGCVTLANNHFRDKGEEGITNTLNACDLLGIDHVGGGRSLTDASKILYKTIEGEKLAIINCCEHEFSLATDERGGSNPLNLARQYYAIKEARGKADFVIVIIHGGHEHYQLPSPRMVETYRFFVDAGADVVLNHHQHCFSGYEQYNGKWIFYGLGNFCFDMINPPTEMWHEGYMVELLLEQDKIGFVLHPFIQCKEDPSVVFKPIESIQDRLDELNVIISDSNKLKDATREYYNDSCIAVKNILFPFMNRYIRALWNRKLFPKVLTKKWLMYLCNYTMCEAHRDKMEYFFEKNMY